MSSEGTPAKKKGLPSGAHRFQEARNQGDSYILKQMREKAAETKHARAAARKAAREALAIRKLHENEALQTAVELGAQSQMEDQAQTGEIVVTGRDPVTGEILSYEDPAEISEAHSEEVALERKQALDQEMLLAPLEID